MSDTSDMMNRPLYGKPQQTEVDAFELSDKEVQVEIPSLSKEEEVEPVVTLKTWIVCLVSCPSKTQTVDAAECNRC